LLPARGRPWLVVEQLRICTKFRISTISYDNLKNNLAASKYTSVQLCSTGLLPFSIQVMSAKEITPILGVIKIDLILFMLSALILNCTVSIRGS